MSKNFTGTDRDVMASWRAQGYSDAAIASHWHTSRQTVHNLLGPRTTDGRRGPNLSESLIVTATPKDTKASNALPGELLKWRAEYGLTQRQAAEIFHLANVGTLSNWERGKHCALPGLVLDYIKLWKWQKDILTKVS